MIIPPGIETNAAYHASGAWGSTLINLFLTSPLLAHLRRTGALPAERSAALDLGQAFHARFDGSWKATVAPTAFTGTRRTKAWTAFQAEHAGRICLLTDELEALTAMEASVRANGYACALLESAQHEVAIRRDAPHGPFQVQCKLDLYRPRLAIADLKTTSDLDGWARSVSSYGYHRQAAFYRWLCAEETGELLPFLFIVVEKQPPHRCRVIELDERYLADGWRDVDEALTDIGTRSVSGDWSDPAYLLLQPFERRTHVHNC